MRDLILFNKTYTGDLSLATPQSYAVTTSTMATPTKNTHYEKEAFEEYISRKKGAVNID